MHYSCAVIILFNRIYTSVNFLLILLKIQFFVYQFFARFVLNSLSFLQIYKICLINVYVTKILIDFVLTFKSSRLEVFCRKVVLRNFAQFTGKHQSRNFIKKETLALVFSCEFREIYNNTIFMEHIRVTASGSHKIIEIKERPSKHLLLLTSTHRK